jgi:hypothetical protein
MQKKVLLVSQDSKVVLQVRQWLRELPEETSLETFANFQDFLKEYPTEKRDEEPVEKAASAAQDEAYIVHEKADTGPSANQVRLLCLDSEILDHQANAFQTLKKVREDFLHGSFSSSEHPARVIIVAHEHSKISADDFAHAGFDDLQIKPLDKDMFLQKVGMYLSDDSRTSGEFLFKQATSYIIEMAKESSIEEISDYGVVVLNPVALAPGVYAHIHSSVFGEKEDGTVWGRVYRSSKHPTLPDSYLCYCAFFGIKSTQLHNLRKYLFNLKKSLHWPNNKVPSATFKGLPCHIAVIDRDEHVRTEIKNTLEQNFSNAKVHLFRSYAHFMKAISPAHKAHPTLNVATEPLPVLPGGSDLTFFVGGDSWDLHEVTPAMTPQDRFCGVYFEQLKASPTKWLECVDPEDRPEFEELLTAIQGGSKGAMTLRLKDQEGFQYPVHFKGALQRSGGTDGSKLLCLDWQILKNEDWVKEMESRSKEGHSLESLEAIFASATGINDVAAWYEGTKAQLEAAGLIKNNRLAICLMEDENNPFLDLQQKRIKNIHAFMFRPIDHKVTLAKAVQLAPGLMPSNPEVDLRFMPAHIPVRLGKDVEMDEVSEYGLQVKVDLHMRSDVFLRFYSPLLDQGGHGILAKCVSCTPDEADKKVFHCFFMFFGVSEAFLKHIRQWIREDYVAKKANEG